MDRDHILREIRRTAAENGGVPLGSRRFATLTGIRNPDWEGKLWARWGDALTEAGFKPNEPKKAYPGDFLLEKLAGLTRELGRVPTRNDMRMKDHPDPTFPSSNTFERVGKGRKQLAASVLSFCKNHEGFGDVAAICETLDAIANIPISEEHQTTNDKSGWGYVYLGKSGRYYKIGRSNSVGRRNYELDIQLPENFIYSSIKTDDPEGIERYWHERFRLKRKNGEWVDLTAQDVSTFRRRKFM